jgi:PBP1b-binding outer membrane lipoprotein LpoB
MKRLLSIFLAILCLQSCYSQNQPSKKTNMDQSKKNTHPNYSHTDSSKLVLTNSEWKN